MLWHFGIAGDDPVDDPINSPEAAFVPCTTFVRWRFLWIRGTEELLAREANPLLPFGAADSLIMLSFPTNASVSISVRPTA